MSIILCLDCQGLFLRHTETGKCITVSEDLAYNSPSYAFPYFVEMTDKCLDTKAQFRYVNNELLHNIVKGGTLGYYAKSWYNKRWVVYVGVVEEAKQNQDSLEQRLKQTAAGSLSLYYRSHPVCAEPSSKNLSSKRYCDQKNQTFTFGK